MTAVLLVASAVLWWQRTTPQVRFNGLAGVWSDDHELLAGEGWDETVYVAPATGAGETTLAFGLHNEGPLRVELVDVWPASPGTCIWQPTDRRATPEHGGMRRHADGPPAAGTVIPAGGQATVWLTGSVPQEGYCEWDGFGVHDTVEVVTRSAGRTSTVVVDLPYTFAYSDDPGQLRDRFRVAVIEPER